MRIMLVDDYEISRAACRALLRAEGVDVVADLRASDDALAAARTLRPEVVIADVTPRSGTAGWAWPAHCAY
jgi:DNA-binding NarL/FixJ family response regulator